MSDSDKVFCISKEQHPSLFNFIQRGNYRPLVTVHMNVFQGLEPDDGISDSFTQEFFKNIVVPLLLESTVISRSTEGTFSTDYSRLEVQNPEAGSELLLNSLEYNVRDLIRESPKLEGTRIKKSSAFIKKTCDLAISKEAIEDIRRGFTKLHQAPNVGRSDSSCTLEFALVGYYEEEKNG